MTTKWKVLIIVVLFIVGSFVTIAVGLYPLAVPTSGDRIGSDADGTALVVIDIQEDFTRNEGPNAFEQADVERLIKTVNELTLRAEESAIPVVYLRQEFSTFFGKLFTQVMTGGLGLEGRPGNRLDPALEVRGPQFVKPIGDGFSSPDFEAHLRELNVSRLVVVGLDGAACVQLTARGAMNRGYAVTFVEEGIVTGFPEDWQEIRDDLVSQGARVTPPNSALDE